MDDQPNPTWYFRSGGVITHAAQENGRDPTLLLRANAFAKRARGEQPAPEEQAAVQAHWGKPLAGTPVGDAFSETVQGFLFTECGEILRALDALALQLAGRLGFDQAEITAWDAITQYAENAAGAAREEAAVWEEVAIDAEQAAQPGGQVVTLRDGTEITITPGPEQTPEELQAAHERSVAESEAFWKTPEGQAMLEQHRPGLEAFYRQVAIEEAKHALQIPRLAETGEPDDGPEGWSTVPPRNSSEGR